MSESANERTVFMVARQVIHLMALLHRLRFFDLCNSGKFVSRLSRFFTLNPLNLLDLLAEKCVMQKAIAQVAIFV